MTPEENALNGDLEFREHLDRMAPDGKLDLASISKKLDFIALELFYQRRKLDDFCKRFAAVEAEHNNRIKDPALPVCPQPNRSRKQDMGIGAILAVGILSLLYTIAKAWLANHGIYI